MIKCVRQPVRSRRKKVEKGIIFQRKKNGRARKLVSLRTIRVIAFILLVLISTRTLEDTESKVKKIRPMISIRRSEYSLEEKREYSKGISLYVLFQSRLIDLGSLTITNDDARTSTGDPINDQIDPCRARRVYVSIRRASHR